MKLDLSDQPLAFCTSEFQPGSLFRTKHGTYHLLINSACGRSSVLTFTREGTLSNVQTYGTSYLDSLRFVGVVDLNLKPEWVQL